MRSQWRRFIPQLERLETRDVPSASTGASIIHSPSGQPPGVIDNSAANAGLVNAITRVDGQALANARAFIINWTPPGRPGREAPQSITVHRHGHVSLQRAVD